MVIGCGGAGKSEFSKRLASLLDLPVIHLDAHFWRPGWREPSKVEWEATVRTLIDRDEWVMDGNYGSTMGLRLSAAEAVVFLDLPRLICLKGVFSRRLRYSGETRPEMAPGCPERVDWKFLKYVWDYRRTRRPGILRRLERLPEEKESYVLKSRAEADAFLGKLGDEVNNVNDVKDVSGVCDVSDISDSRNEGGEI